MGGGDGAAAAAKGGGGGGPAGTTGAGAGSAPQASTTKPNAIEMQESDGNELADRDMAMKVQPMRDMT